MDNSRVKTPKSKLPLVVPTAEDMRALGARLGERLAAGDVLLLRGPLGAGKTTLVQGLAIGLEAADLASSPTFVLANEYPGRLPLYHLDLYRLDDPAEIEEIGFEEYLYGQGVTAVEWPDQAQGLLPAESLSITIAIRPDESRQVELRAAGARYEALLESLRRA